MSETSEGEAVIFGLRKKADLFLQAGDTEAVNRIQSTIANLQHIYGVVKGTTEGKDARES